MSTPYEANVSARSKFLGNVLREEFEPAVEAQIKFARSEDPADQSAAADRMAELTASARLYFATIRLFDQGNIDNGLADLEKAVKQEAAKRMKISPHHNGHSPNGENGSHVNRTGYEDSRPEFHIG